jgi:hypothetical protein
LHCEDSSIGIKYFPTLSSAGSISGLWGGEAETTFSRDQSEDEDARDTDIAFYNPAYALPPPTTAAPPLSTFGGAKPKQDSKKAKKDEKKKEKKTGGKEKRKGKGKVSTDERPDSQVSQRSHQQQEEFAGKPHLEAWTSVDPQHQVRT